MNFDARKITHDAPPYMSPYLLPSILPQADNISFTDSSFFARHDSQLPTPEEVRRAAGANFRIGRPPPVRFQSLNLLVKYGSAINIAEGQCLWAVSRYASGVPVPEIYGWRPDFYRYGDGARDYAGAVLARLKCRGKACYLHPASSHNGKSTSIKTGCSRPIRR